MNTLLKKLIVVFTHHLKKRNFSVVTAESCTGGGLAYSFASLPSCSSVLERGYITYSNESKIELFNIDELCPTNAPKRCEWCKGPYHIRKRCPKLAALSNDYEKKRRVFNNSEQQSYMNNYLPFSSNNFREKSYYNDNQNAYNHSKFASSNQRSHQYVANEKSREFYNASHQSVEQTTNFNYQNNYPRKECFSCGSFDHLRAQCPLLHKNNRSQKPKFTN